MQTNRNPIGTIAARTGLAGSTWVMSPFGVLGNC